MELASALLRHLPRMFMRLEVDGLDRLPSRGPAIVAVNHTTRLDPIVALHGLWRAGLRTSPPCGRPGCGDDHGHVRFLASAEVFANPLTRVLARNAGMIEGPVAMRGLRVGDPRKRMVAAGAAAMRAAGAALRRGEIVGIYPEGTIASTPDGSPGRFRPGLGRLALDTGAPVIPVVHHDARKIGDGDWGRCLVEGVTSVIRRPKVRVRVGEPVRPAEIAGLAVREAVGVVHQRMLDLWRGLSADLPRARPPGVVEKSL